MLGVYPKEFYLGSRSAYDKAAAKPRREMTRLYPPLEARLRKTAAFVAKRGATLTVLLSAPVTLGQHIIDEIGSQIFGNLIGLDVLVALNRSGEPKDGELWIAGAAASDFPQVEYHVKGPDSGTGTAGVSDSRWTVHLTQGGNFFQKGNYSVAVRGGLGQPDLDARVFSFR